MRFINPSQSLYAGVVPARACPVCGGQSCCPPMQCRMLGSTPHCVTPLGLSSAAPARAPGRGAISGAAIGPVLAGNPPRLHNQHHGPMPRMASKSRSRTTTDRALLASAALSGALANVLNMIGNPCSVRERDEMCGIRR